MVVRSILLRTTLQLRACDMSLTPPCKGVEWLRSVRSRARDHGAVLKQNPDSFFPSLQCILWCGCPSVLLHEWCSVLGYMRGAYGTNSGLTAWPGLKASGPAARPGFLGLKAWLFSGLSLPLGASTA
jgi:hypothetical protein